MKVLFCTNVFQNITNGPAKFAHIALQVKEFDSDIEVRVLTEDTGGDIDNRVYKLHLRIPSFFNKASQFIRMFAYHKKAMKIHESEYPFDILIYNHAMIGLWSAFRFKNTWGFINDDNNASATASKLFRTLSFSSYFVFHYFEKLSVRYLQKIIVNSNYLRNFIIKQYPAAKNKTVVFYKGIEFTPLHEIKEKEKRKIPEILFVKNDYERGGIFQLIEAMKKLPMQLKLIVIGPHAYVKPRLETACSHSNVMLHFLGIQSQKEIYNHMQMADVFCVPSVQEGFGVANIEAMALGCSVVTTSAGGIPEVMLSEMNGWMTEPGNIDQLVAALGHCLSDGQEKMRRAKNGLLRSQEFTKEKTLKRFSELLHDNL
ncbi:MAG: glycosyltransferase family 4 protein [Chitinophagales bacterium]